MKFFQPRQPKGQPVGGQFATQRRSEDEVKGLPTNTYRWKLPGSLIEERNGMTVYSGPLTQEFLTDFLGTYRYSPVTVTELEGGGTILTRESDGITFFGVDTDEAWRILIGEKSRTTEALRAAMGIEVDKGVNTKHRTPSPVHLLPVDFETIGRALTSSQQDNPVVEVYDNEEGPFPCTKKQYDDVLRTMLVAAHEGGQTPDNTVQPATPSPEIIELGRQLAGKDKSPDVMEDRWVRHKLWVTGDNEQPFVSATSVYQVRERLNDQGRPVFEVERATRWTAHTDPLDPRGTTTMDFWDETNRGKPGNLLGVSFSDSDKALLAARGAAQEPGFTTETVQRRLAESRAWARRRNVGEV